MKLKFAYGLDIVMVSGFLACLFWAMREKPNVIPEANFDSINHLDSDFIKYAIASNHAEIQFARTAQSKSVDQEIKDIAIVLEKDHIRILESLMEIAQRKNIAIDKYSDLAKDNSLSRLSGKDFDKRWCSEMIGNHEAGFQLMELVWEKSDDSEVKDVISASLPHLISHLEWLVDYQESLGRKDQDSLPTTAPQIAAN